MSKESRDLPHIYLPENGKSENYTRPGGGSNPPPPDLSFRRFVSLIVAQKKPIAHLLSLI